MEKMTKLTNEELLRKVIKAAVELAIIRHSLTDEDVEERDDFDMEFVTADTANAAFGVDTCVEEPIPEVAEILQRMAEGAAGEASPQGDLYVISVTGDGGQTTIVPEAQLKAAVHEAYCACGKLWDKCADEVITNTIAKLDDAEEWTQNYPTYERHIWLDHGEDYTVQVMRVTPKLPIVSGSASTAGPRPRCPNPSCKSDKLWMFWHEQRVGCDSCRASYYVLHMTGFAQFFAAAPAEDTKGK